MSKKHYQDLIIVGGGAGGLSVTSAAAQLGLRVTLVEKAPQLGGDCLHYGCVPSKTFIQAAKVAHHCKIAAQYGINASLGPVDLAAVNQRVHDVIAQIQPHDDPERFRSYGADVVFGNVTLRNNHSLYVDDDILQGKRIVIATGSSPVVPPITGLKDAGFITNETVFNLKTLPKKLLLIGGGFIGLELGQAFARLGSEVHVIDAAASLFPRIDREIAMRLQRIFESEGIIFHLNKRILNVSNNNGEKTIECLNEHDDSEHLSGDEILLAIGRRPNVTELGLEEAGVAFSPRGISVNARLRTSCPTIYAMGDVIDSPYKFTHMAEYHAGIIVKNCVFRLPSSVNYKVVPAVVFSDPEFANVGLSEDDAKAQGLNPTVLRYELRDLDRAITAGETSGLAKIVVRKGKILGASILAPHAGELIAEIALAMQNNLGISAISKTIHAYPTYAQLNRRTINTYYSDKLFSAGTRRLVKWLNRLRP